MNQEDRIKAAIEQGGIKQIVIIDDAFDAPLVRDEDAGSFLDFLTKEESARARRKISLTPEEIEGAISALENTEYDDAALTTVVAKIYAEFVKKLEDQFDPSRRFTILKGSNLASVRPLLKLLSTCSDLQIIRIGSKDSDYQATVANAHVLFVDYYMDAAFTPDSDPDSQQGNNARTESLKFLKDVLDTQDAHPGTGPSIMLMSAHAVRDKADAFRRDVRDKKKPIFASRFHFMAKTDLSEREDGSIEIAKDAANALLDIAQCHIFAGAIEDALTHWKKGVDEAVEDIWKTISELELKDFAYLSRFRLAEEGQSLSSYMEWFFGEAIVDAIARKVDWNAKSFTTLNQGTVKGAGAAGSQIEGAFDGPTAKIAELYYRVRVDARKGEDFRLGDVYAAVEGNELLAVLTPDCDLIERKKKRSAPRLTVVAGTIHPLNAPDTSIADFFKKGGEHCNIVWNTKDIRTVEYETVGREDGVRFLGTLRPLYAQELQRRVLNELSRVGLAVAPAMAITAKAAVVVRGIGEDFRLSLSNPNQASCAVIPKRGGTDKPRIVYHRSFAQEVLEKLAQATDKVHDTAKGDLANLLSAKNQIKFMEKLCRQGQQDGEDAFGVLSTLGSALTGEKAPWCQIVITFHAPNEGAEGHIPDEGNGSCI